MEQQRVIPTRFKSKIPQTLSYPIGAKAISAALVGAPQFDDLSVNFWSWKVRSSAATPYRVIQIGYSGPNRQYSAPFRSTWSITVNAVPRHLRHVIQEKIAAEALPFIRSWLIANAHSSEREGGHGLIFEFDELKHELTHDEQFSIDWQTPRVGRPD
jgi:hypothetical protein